MHGNYSFTRDSHLDHAGLADGAVADDDHLDGELYVVLPEVGDVHVAGPAVAGRLTARQPVTGRAARHRRTWGAIRNYSAFSELTYNESYVL